jgi:3-phosphoshikimate 1-carboxyvinyltransferase
MSSLRVEGNAGPLTGELTVPGDKSIGHRAVIFASIAHGRTEVRGLSGGEDNLRTIAVLRALGVPIRDLGPGAVEVDGVGLDGLRASDADLDCGNSGTSIRLLSGLLAPRPFRSRLVGDQYLHARPMMRVAEPLRQMGAAIDGASGKKAGEIYPPLLVGGAPAALRGVRYVSKVASAQVKSAVLLAAMGAEGATTFVEPAVSRDHTERMLAAAGAPLVRSADGHEVTLDPTGWSRRLAARDLAVPGDLSSAAFVLGAATLVPGSRVVVRDVGVNPTRTGFLDALLAMGGQIELGAVRERSGEPVADLTCTSAALRGIEISGTLTVRAIDELPLLAALAAHADGPTSIRDAAELRVKESDRIAATAALLRAFGAEVEEHPDGLTILGRGALRAGHVDSHGDHRIAMAAAICALAIPGVTRIDDVANIATSFPTFQPALERLGANLHLEPRERG